MKISLELDELEITQLLTAITVRKEHCQSMMVDEASSAFWSPRIDALTTTHDKIQEAWSEAIRENR